MAAALLSVVSSLPPSEAAPIPDSKSNMEKIANAKVKATRYYSGCVHLRWSGSPYVPHRAQTTLQPGFSPYALL